MSNITKGSFSIEGSRIFTLGEDKDVVITKLDEYLDIKDMTKELNKELQNKGIEIFEVTDYKYYLCFKNNKLAGIITDNANSMDDSIALYLVENGLDYAKSLYDFADILTNRYETLADLSERTGLNIVYNNSSEGYSTSKITKDNMVYKIAVSNRYANTDIIYIVREDLSRELNSVNKYIDIIEALQYYEL